MAARLVMSLLGLLAAADGFAGSLDHVPDLPRAEAIRASDGTYVLTLYPPTAWIGAEVDVKGTDAVDLGPATPGRPVQVRGYTSRKGALQVTLRIATPEKVGITWEFEVEPTLVPARAPELERSPAPAKRRGRR